MSAPPLPTTPSMRLDGRRALVTGAGRGIGLAAAAALAEAGAHVTLCARTASDIEEAAKALREKGFAADTLALDVTDVKAFRAAVDAREPYHAFVNNAGTNRPNSIGGYVSYGCVRMYNQDISDLFERVSVGTMVVVTSH